MFPFLPCVYKSCSWSVMVESQNQLTFFSPHWADAPSNIIFAQCLVPPIQGFQGNKASSKMLHVCHFGQFQLQHFSQVNYLLKIKKKKKKCTLKWSRHVMRSGWISIMNLIILSAPCTADPNTMQERVHPINMHALSVWLHYLVGSISNQSCLHATSERSQEVSAYDSLWAAFFGDAVVISLRREISNHHFQRRDMRLGDEANWFH